MRSGEKRTKKAKKNKKLSSLTYSKYKRFLVSKCRYNGIELIMVNAKFTSIIGSMLYAKALGVSVHGAAAGVIARRGQGFVEAEVAVGKTIEFPQNGKIRKMKAVAVKRSKKPAYSVSKSAPVRMQTIPVTTQT